MIAAIKALIDTLVQFFTKLWQKVSDVVTWVSDLAVAIFKAGWDFATDVVAWAFDGPQPQPNALPPPGLRHWW